MAPTFKELQMMALLTAEAEAEERADRARAVQFIVAGVDVHLRPMGDYSAKGLPPRAPAYGYYWEAVPETRPIHCDTPEHSVLHSTSKLELVNCAKCLVNYDSTCDILQVVQGVVIDPTRGFILVERETYWREQGFLSEEDYWGD